MPAMPGPCACPGASQHPNLGRALGQCCLPLDVGVGDETLELGDKEQARTFRQARAQVPLQLGTQLLPQTLWGRRGASGGAKAALPSNASRGRGGELCAQAHEAPSMSPSMCGVCTHSPCAPEMSTRCPRLCRPGSGGCSTDSKPPGGEGAGVSHDAWAGGHSH